MLWENREEVTLSWVLKYDQGFVRTKRYGEREFPAKYTECINA